MADETVPSRDPLRPSLFSLLYWLTIAGGLAVTALSLAGFVQVGGAGQPAGLLEIGRAHV